MAIHCEIYGEENKGFDLIFEGRQQRTKQYKKYNIREYVSYYNEYYIPTITNEEIITSTVISPYNTFKSNTIVVFKKKREFTFLDYKYTINKNIVNVEYIGDKNKITNYPFCGFNNLSISYEKLYENCNFYEFDFDYLNLERCVSTKNMFTNCRKLTIVKNLQNKLNIIRDVSFMFSFCISLESIDLSKTILNLSIFDIDNMFLCCCNLKEVIMTSITIIGSYIYDNVSIFRYCYQLRKLKMKTETFNKIKKSLPMSDLWINSKKTRDTYSDLEIVKYNENKNKSNISTYYNSFFMNDIYMVNETEFIIKHNTEIVKDNSYFSLLDDEEIEEKEENKK